MYTSIDSFMSAVITRNKSQEEFHQAVREVVESLWDFIKGNPQYQHNKVLERILERKPDYINALNNLANLKTTLEKYEEAIKLFEHEKWCHG